MKETCLLTDDERETATQDLIVWFSRFSNPVAITVNLRPVARFKDAKTGQRRTKKLEYPTIDTVVEFFGSQFRKSQLPKEQRQQKKDSPMVFGCYERGKISNQPHLHLVVDNEYGLMEHHFRWMLLQCLRNTHDHLGWISGEPVIEFDCDSGWIHYLTKSEDLYMVMSK